MKRKLIILFVGLLFTVISFFNVKRVNAQSNSNIEKTLVVQKGSEINDYIKFDNYVVINNNVNVNQEGIYSITYKNIETNAEVVKRIVVIDGSTYSNDFVEKMYLLENYNYKFIDSCIGPNGPNYLISYEMPRRFGENLIIEMMDGTSLQVMWSLNGEVLDFKYVDGHYLGCGHNKNSMNGDVEMFLFDLYQDKKILQNITNPGYEVATSVTLNDNYYFLAGYTTESSDLFKGRIDDQDSVLVVLDKETKEVVNSVVIGVKGDDYILDMYYLDSKLYLVQVVDNSNFRMLVCDIFGNILREKIINVQYGYDNLKLKKDSNNLFLSYSYYNYNHLDYEDVIYKVDNDLSMEEVFSRYDSTTKIVDYYLNDNIMSLVLGYKKSSKNFIYQIYVDKSLVLEHYCNSQNTPIAIFENYIVGSLPSTFTVYGIDSIYINNPPIKEIDTRYNVLEDIINYSVLLNGKEVKCNNPVDNNFLNKKFGDYTINYYFEGKVDYLSSTNITILPFVGVVNSGTYDRGITIDGNGEVRINNIDVDLPYTIDKPGEYTIEITGKDKKETFTFVVQDLSLNKNIEEDEKNLNLDVLRTTSDYDLTILYNKRSKTEKNNNNFIYVYILPVIVASVGVFLIRKGGRS